MAREGKEEEEQSRSNDGVKWRRGTLIGKGAFGSVYMANLKTPTSRNSCFPPIMAVKSAEFSVSGSLQKEKEVLLNLQGCPFILKCFGEETTFGQNSVMFFNVLLEYASAGTLADRIKKSNGCGLHESDVRVYTRSVLKGLKHIHDCGYVHCDLKPENILLFPIKSSGVTAGSLFRAKIGDFGLTKRAFAQIKKRKLDPYLRGTAMYMAPECVIDHIQEPPSDIWALGCIVLEMLTGKDPWNLKPNYKSHDLLNLISNKHELPKIPTGISKEAKEFLKGCLVRNSKFRLTAEMLMSCAFVKSGEGDEEAKEEELDEVEETEYEDSSSCSWSEASDEFDYSGYSSLSEGESSYRSWSEEVEEIESSGEEVTMEVRKRKRSQNFITINDAEDVFNRFRKAPSRVAVQSKASSVPATI